MQENSNSCPVLMPEQHKNLNTDLNYCSHCGTPVGNIKKELLHETIFCCKGCEFIYKTLNGLGLQAYYKFLSSSEEKANQALGIEEKNFAHFDDPALQKLWLEKLSETSCRVSFYLPSVHCVACIWLLEKLPTILQQVTEARVFFAEGKIEISYNPQLLKLSQIGKTLNSLGYTPIPLSDPALQASNKKENRKMLFRIGIAGFCAANTMMISVSIFESFYSGMDAQIANFLRWTSAAVTLPAVVYSAVPFYRTAIAALLTGALHIDLPIAAAIILAYLAGIHSCINGDPYIYFDSISTLIFLLLAGRYIQTKAISRARASAVSSWDLLPSSVRVIENSTEHIRTLKELAIFDTVRVLAGERIPADGLVVEGYSSLDRSFLTGESAPVSVAPGSEVAGGAINVESELLIRVTKSGSDSRIGKILSQIDRQQSSRTKAEDRANRLSSYFVGAVFFISVAAYFVWEQIDPARSFEIVVAFLTVTCPCALGLAIPAAVSIALSKAKKRGVFIRRSDAFEAIAEADNFYFDKTKTLTTGNLQVEKFCLTSNENISVLKQLSLCGRVHPIGKAIYDFCCKNYPDSSSPGLNCKHFPGRGVEASAARCWRLGSQKWLSELGIIASEQDLSQIEALKAKGLSISLLAVDSEICGIFGLSDSICPESEKIISFLKSRGKNIFILSGDSYSAVKNVASQLGIAADNAHAELLPEQKLAMMSGKSCMIGDGLNDAQSMKGSFVSIGLRGGIEATIEVASIFISSGKLLDLYDLLQASFATIRTIRLNITYAVLYNIVGGTLALAGYINPLFAAFIMPISSITIIVHSLMNKSFKRDFRKKAN